MLHHAPPTCRRVVVAAREGTRTWRRVVNLPVPGFLSGGRSGDGALDGGVVD